MKEIKFIKDFYNAINNNKLIIIFFYADWCLYSKKMLYILLELEKIYNNTLFYCVNIDINKDIIEICNIYYIPTFHFYCNNVCIC